jgi:hypothetical protein
LISNAGYSSLGNMASYTTAQRAARDKVRDYLDKNFSGQYNANAGGVSNPIADADRVRSFISNQLSNAAAGQYIDPWGVGANAISGDMYNVFFAEEVIKEFKPELLVVNMQDVDVCHFDFTRYADYLRRADYAAAHLWHTIQNTPGMANDTVMIVVPEHGRNAQPNTVVDAYGRYAIDHTAIDSAGGDQMSREIFCLVVGPNGIVRQDLTINQVRGESIDLVPTIATILGFDGDIPASVSLPGSHLVDAFI